MKLAPATSFIFKRGMNCSSIPVALMRKVLESSLPSHQVSPVEPLVPARPPHAVAMAKTPGCCKSSLRMASKWLCMSSRMEKVKTSSLLNPRSISRMNFSCLLTTRVATIRPTEQVNWVITKIFRKAVLLTPKENFPLRTCMGLKAERRSAG